MPITECEIHGESGSPEMCEHLHAHLKQAIYLPYHTLPVYTIRLCDACFEAHGVQAILDALVLEPDAVEALRLQATGLRRIGPAHLFEAEFLERAHPQVLAQIVLLYEALNQKSGFRCQGCIDQVQLDHARRTNADLPFEPFENTIFHGEDGRIDALRNLVLDHMEPRGNLGNSFFGCTIFSGTVRRPLTLKIYGVSLEKQEEMLRLIEGFFAKVAQDQRRVQFFEPIRWTVHESEEGSTRLRQPDVLVRDVLVR